MFYFTLAMALIFGMSAAALKMVFFRRGKPMIAIWGGLCAIVVSGAILFLICSIYTFDSYETVMVLAVFILSYVMIFDFHLKR